MEEARIFHYFEVSDFGGAMHQVSRNIKKIYFVYDHDSFYLRILFNTAQFKQIDSQKIVVEFSHLKNSNIEIPFRKCNTMCENNLTYAFDEELEIAIKRDKILVDGFGEILFSVSLFEGDNKIETVPDIEPIQIEIPKKGQEMFWLT